MRMSFIYRITRCPIHVKQIELRLASLAGFSVLRQSASMLDASYDLRSGDPCRGIGASVISPMKRGLPGPRFIAFEGDEVLTGRSESLRGAYAMRVLRSARGNIEEDMCDLRARCRGG